MSSHELEERVEQYRKLTREALEKASIIAKKGTVDFKRAKDFLSMARNYFEDAKHFELHGKLLLALAAYSYAHAWLDAGVRAKILDGKGDDRLFTLP